MFGTTCVKGLNTTLVFILFFLFLPCYMWCGCGLTGCCRVRGGFKGVKRGLCDASGPCVAECEVGLLTCVSSNGRHQAVTLIAPLITAGWQADVAGNGSTPSGDGQRLIAVYLWPGAIIFLASIGPGATFIKWDDCLFGAPANKSGATVMAAHHFGALPKEGKRIAMVRFFYWVLPESSHPGLQCFPSSPWGLAVARIAWKRQQSIRALRNHF